MIAATCRAPVLAALLPIVSVGCIGAPVVGRQPPGEERMCMAAPSCDDQPERPALEPIADATFRYVSGPECLPGGEAIPWTCDGGSSDDDRWCEAQREVCELLLSGESLEGGTVGGCRTDARTLLTGALELTDVDLVCTDLRFELAEGASITIRGGRHTALILDVVGGTDSVVRLIDVEGSHVHVTLGGHAWLDVRENSRITKLTVDADPAMEGRVAAFTDSRGNDLRVRTGARGELFVSSGVVFAGVLDVGQLVLGSADLTMLRIRANSLLAGGTILRQSALELGDSLITAGTLEDVTVARCASLRITDCQVTESDVGPCDTALYVAGESSVVLSTLRGSTDIEDGLVLDSLFASTVGGSHVFRGADVRESAFCATQRVEAQGGRFNCVTCEPDIVDVVLEGVDVDAPGCPSLELAIDP